VGANGTVRFSGLTINAASSVTLTIVVTVTNTASFTNTATVTPGLPVDPVSGNNSSAPQGTTVTPRPTTANAGPDQPASSLCGLTNTTLAGNTPSIGTGRWSVFSGTGGSFANSNNPTTTFSGNAGTSYTLRWTISNPPCSDSTADVSISFPANTIAADAGPDQNICANSATLAGNNPGANSGTWTLISGTGSIVDPTNPSTLVTNLSIGTNIFRWTVIQPSCSPSSNDVAIVVDNTPPTPSCPGNFSVTNTPGLCGTNVTYTVGASDNCTVVSTNQLAGLTNGAFFPVGKTTNVFVFADAVGNTNICTFVVTVKDMEAPVLATPAGSDHTTNCPSEPFFTAPTFNDVCKGAVTPTQSRRPI
jgi:hypothetical protein